MARRADGDESRPSHPISRQHAVQQALGHAFTDTALLDRAYTHASFIEANAPAKQRREQANERLEFLGDAVLGAVVSQLLYERHPDADEGELTKRRGRLVSRAALATGFAALGLDAHARVGHPLKPPLPESVLANLAEAVLAAIWLDGGQAPLHAAVLRLLAAGPADELPQASHDSKSALQERTLALFQVRPTYATERSGGSDHAPEFTCTVAAAGQQATGHGPSRRAAEAAAASALLATLTAPGNPG